MATYSLLRLKAVNVSKTGQTSSNLVKPDYMHIHSKQDYCDHEWSEILSVWFK